MGCHCLLFAKRSARSLVETALLTSAWLLNVSAIVSCNFVNVNNGLETDLELVHAMGLYTVQGQDGYCYVVNWSEFTRNVPYWMNSSMNNARICGVTAAFIGFIIMMISWLRPCFCRRRKHARYILAGFALVCGLLSCFMFLVNSSSICEYSGCRVSKGGGLAVGAILCYFVSGMMLLYIAVVYPVVDERQEAKVGKPSESPETLSDEEELGYYASDSSSFSSVSEDEPVDSSNLLETSEKDSTLASTKDNNGSLIA